MTPRPGGLGRLVKPDPRDHLHPMRAAIPHVEAPASRMWTAGAVLDQGDTSQCTAYAWVGFLSASPTRTRGAYVPAALYGAEQAIDGWALPHDGSSVRAGAQVLQRDGRLSEYVWAFDADTVKRFVLTRGPVVLGTAWYEAMFTPTRDGFVEPAGSVEGGHAYLCVGYSAPRDAFRLVNSWGTGWGQHGRAWLRRSALVGLLADEGEACSAIECVPAVKP